MRKSLSEILHGRTAELQAAWERTTEAEEFAPLPAGTYRCKIIAAESCESKHCTPSYKLTFKIIEGDLKGRQFWLDLWLTEAALPMTKRDLGKLGVKNVKQLENPLPAVFLCTVKLALRVDDNGNEYNRVRSFEVTGHETIEDADFAPAPVPQAPTGSAESTTSADEDELELLPFAKKAAEGLRYGNE